jgi:hypothetical protein
MYHCDWCGAQTKKGQSLLKTETYREKSYRNRTSNEAKKLTRGYEIEKEYKLCPKCKANSTKADEEDSAVVIAVGGKKLSPEQARKASDELNRVIKGGVFNATPHS